ncbi:MAG: hypothetical protein ABIR62_06525 [Dokdonella sp.]
MNDRLLHLGNPKREVFIGEDVSDTRRGTGCELDLAMLDKTAHG